MSGYHERIERQLVARVQAGAGAPLHTRARERFRRTKLGVLIPAAVTFAVAGAFIVLLSGHHLLNANPGSTKAPSSDQASGVPSGVLRAYPVFRRPRARADNLPAYLAPGLRHVGRRLGLVFSESRLVLRTRAETMWLVPGHRSLCLVSSANAARNVGASCGQVSSAERMGFVSLSAHAATAVLPSGAGPVLVTRMGAQTLRIVPPTNGVVAVTSARPLLSVSWTGADGRTHTLCGCWKSPRLR